MRRFPWIALLLVTAGALVQGAPAAAELLIYDRMLVNAGEWWRVVTAHVVHFGWRHFAWDAVALLAGGALVEREGRARFAALCAIAALFAGFTVHTLAPELVRYAGLSALAYASLTFAALRRAQYDVDRRPLWLLVLVALTVKLVLDGRRGVPMLWDGDANVVVAGAAHLAGSMAASATFLLVRRRPQRVPAR